MAREQPMRNRLDGALSPDEHAQLPEVERLELVRLMRLPDEEITKQLDAMERGKRRRFQRAMETMREEQEKHGRSTVSKSHLAWALGKYTERVILPYAARLDTVEAFMVYQSLPFWRRWWVDLRRIVQREIPEYARAFVRWLDSKGIRFVKVEAES